MTIEPPPRTRTASGSALLTLAAFVIVVAGMQAAQPVIIPFLLSIFIAVTTISCQVIPGVSRPIRSPISVVIPPHCRQRSLRQRGLNHNVSVLPGLQFLPIFVEYFEIVARDRKRW